MKDESNGSLEERIARKKKWLSAWLLCFTFGGCSELPDFCSYIFSFDVFLCLDFLSAAAFKRLKSFATETPASHSIKFCHSLPSLCWITKERLFVQMECIAGKKWCRVVGSFRTCDMWVWKPSHLIHLFILFFRFSFFSALAIIVYERVKANQKSRRNYYEMEKLKIEMQSFFGVSFACRLVEQKNTSDTRIFWWQRTKCFDKCTKE